MNVKGRFLNRRHCIIIMFTVVLICFVVTLNPMISQAKSVQVMNQKTFERLNDLIFRYNNSAEYYTTGNIVTTTRTNSMDAPSLIDQNDHFSLSRWKSMYNNSIFTRAKREGKPATLFEIRNLNSTITYTYKNMGMQNGKSVDCKVTYSGFVPTNDYNSVIWQGYSYPCIDISHSITDGYWSMFLKQFHINMEFVYEDGTPANVGEFYLYNGSMNLGEGLVSPNTSSQIYIMKDTNVVQMSDGMFGGASSYFNDNVGGETKTTTDGQVLRPFDANAISMKCTGNSVSYTVFQNSIKNSDLIVNGVSWETEPNTGTGNGPNSDFWNAISFSPLRTSVAPMPEKTVMVNGKEEASIDNVDVGDEVQFKVKQEVEILGMNGSAKYDSFSLKDSLPRELDYKDAYILDEGTGKKVAAANYTLSISSDKKTISAAFAPDFLENGMRYEGETYSLVVNTAVNSSTYGLSDFQNLGSTVIDGDDANTNSIKITAKPPTLAITKTTSKYEWQVGDKVNYTVKVTHASDSSHVPFKNIVVSDVSLPNGLVATDYSVSGVSGATVAKSGNGWLAKAARLESGQSLAITYHCTAMESANGKETVNIAKARADNALEVQDKAEIYVNTATLQIGKNVSMYEWRVGDEVDYTVKVKNTAAGSIARNVKISDLTLPDGLNLKTAPSLSAPTSILNPVAGSKTVAGETQSKQVISSVAKSTGGWTASISDLAANQEATITFHCTAGKNVNGTEIQNTARTKADNAVEVKAAAKIWINTPGLKIDKSADIGKVKVGDLITYTVKVRNTKAGTLARNVVIEDALHDEAAAFVKLQKNSIALTDSDGKKIEDATISVEGNSFKIETGRMLVCPQEYYGIWDIDNAKDMSEGSKLNPKGVTKESVLTVEYQVKITNDEATGEEIKNTAAASCDEGVSVKDKDTVIVNGPHLDVVKDSDKKAYTTEETAEYLLTVRQTREGYSAKDVVVTDHIQEPGATILADTIKVKINGTVISPDVVTMEEDNAGFKMETGQDLSDEDKMKITYNVKFAPLEIDTVDEEYTNTAIAKGSNTNASQDDNKVAVTERDAALQVVKQADRNDYIVGDTGKYTLLILEQVDGASAKQVTVKDTFDKEGMTIIEDSITVKVNGETITPKSIILNETQNSFVIETGVDLSWKDKMKVFYDVKFNQPIESEETTNTAVVKADNSNEDTTDFTATVKEIIPVLKVDKGSDKADYTVGETGTYTISIKQTKIKGVAKQVIITDAFDKEGMIIEEDSIVMKVNGESITPKSITLNEAQNGYVIDTGMDLGKQDVMTLSYDVKFQRAVEDRRTTNTVVANAANAAESQADHSVVVRDAIPVLTVEKASDKESYMVGDTAKYLITVKQAKEYAVAKQVVIKDRFDREGMSIVEESIQIKVNNQEITPQLVSLNAEKNSYTIETGVNLVQSDILTITYDVKFGQPIYKDEATNTAIANADNGEEAVDKLTVSVERPVPTLTLLKEADRSEANKGDIVTYTLTAKEEKDYGAARNVSISDSLEHEGVVYLTDTIKVYDKDMEDITKDCEITVNDRDFQIDTQEELEQGEALSVVYETRLEDVHAGDDVKNIAIAKGSNTEEVTVEAHVQVPTIAEAVETGLKNHAGVYAGIAVSLLAIAGILIKHNRRFKDDGKI
ncbi:MAG TPA: hypothetical protein DCX82_07755 [Lachnospiraceae bacterium]|nr:hypothetical protein [Lachnospiraceae bacterium]